MANNEVSVGFKIKEAEPLTVTWQNINTHAPEVDKSIFSKIFKKNSVEDQRKHILRHGLIKFRRSNVF